MPVAAARSRRLESELRSVLDTGLDARRAEIERELYGRVYAIADPLEAADPSYADGLRSAVAAALDYGFAAIEGDRRPPMPIPLLAQARLAARSGVDLGTVLRRYFAGYTLFSDFLVEEAGRAGMGESELRRLLRRLAAAFEGLVAAVTEEHAREARSRPSSKEQRQAECVERLLAGDPVDSSQLAYDFDVCHLGVIARGTGAARALQGLCTAFDCQSLAIRRDGDLLWAWLGAVRGLDPDRVSRRLAEHGPGGLVLALGEPGRGLAGWRLSHRQAQAALPIAERAPETAVRYREVAVLASMMQDELLAASLRVLYVEPLERHAQGRSVWLPTLRAYFAARCNTASTASTLGVTRQTVTNRLRAIEGALDRPLDTCAQELSAILRLEDLRNAARR